MKPWRLTRFLFVAVVVLAACQRPAVETRRGTSIQSSELLAVDSLLWTQPDSALTCLMACYDTVGDRHYANLLLAELLYKNDYEQTNRTELLAAVAYYDSVSDPFLAARAHYINGVGYYERDSVVPACEEYLKAVEIMEEHFTEKELVGQKAKFMAYSFNRLGDLFSKQFMMQPSINCFERSLHFCTIEPTSPQGVSKTLYLIGKQYDKLNETDKAREYYLSAIKEAPSHNTPFYRDILVYKALCDYQTIGDIAQTLNVLKQTFEQAANEDERLTRSFVIGAILSEEGMFDSALYYLTPVFANEENLNRKIQATEYLRVIYDSLGNKEELGVCERFLACHKKTEGESKALVSMLDNIYENHLNKIQERKMAKERHSVIVLTGKIGIILFLMVTVIIVVMKFRGQRQLKEREREFKKQQVALSGRLRKSNEALRNSLETIKKQEIEAKERTLFYIRQYTDLLAKQGKTMQKLAIVMENREDKALLDNLRATVFDKKDPWDALVEVFDTLHPDERERIRQQYPELTEMEFKDIILSYFGVSRQDEALMLKTSVHTIDKIRTSVKKKTQESAEKL